jgi:hypothetical protein
MDNVQNCDSNINIPSSQTYRSNMKCNNIATPLTADVRYVRTSNSATIIIKSNQGALNSLI